ncbi:MAG: VCBS repeat-containing protein, partial [Gemmatimonadetes bacterium]|nr:VCBS repeat-containing protein [Gemmatimonadota bacterium]
MLRNALVGPRLALAAASLSASLLAVSATEATTWQFTDVTAGAGITLPHAMQNLNLPEERMSGGVACGDYNNDGWLDLYHIRGNSGTNVLYRNNGDGTFSDQAAATGVDVGGQIQMGATFADWTGDGRLDLFLGGAAGTRLKNFEQQIDGTFKQVTD